MAAYPIRALLRVAVPKPIALWIRGEWLARRIVSGTAPVEGEVALLPRLVGPKDVCWDIGANAGMYTLPLSRLTAKVYAFEPVPHNLAILRKVVARAGLANVTISTVALSDREGTSRMRVPTLGFYGGYYLATLDEHGDVPVATDSIDGLIAKGYTAPTFLKCDVEGVEMAVINGARELIARSRPPWLLETFDDQVWPLMESLGYVALMNTRDGRLHRAPGRIESARNYWFVSPELADRLC